MELEISAAFGEEVAYVSPIDAAQNRQGEMANESGLTLITWQPGLWGVCLVCAFLDGSPLY